MERRDLIIELFFTQYPTEFYLAPTLKKGRIKNGKVKREKKNSSKDGEGSCQGVRWGNCRLWMNDTPKRRSRHQRDRSDSWSHTGCSGKGEDISIHISWSFYHFNHETFKVPSQRDSNNRSAGSTAAHASESVCKNPLKTPQQTSWR